MPVPELKNAPAVSAAQARENGLYLKIDGLWCRAESKAKLLDFNITLLIDQADSHGYFAETFAADYPGQADDGDEPKTFRGGTEDAVVAAIMEDYLSRQPIFGAPIDLAVPTLADAESSLPRLRAERYSRDGIPDHHSVG